MHARIASVFIALVAAPALGGCLAEGAGASQADLHRVSGAFTEDATQDDFRALEAELEPYGARISYMESFPVQYQVADFEEPHCEEIRSILDAKPFVHSVGACQPIGPGSADPDAPVSSGAS